MLVLVMINIQFHSYIKLLKCSLQFTSTWVTCFLYCACIDRIAIIPAASYGMAIVAANVHRIPNISSKKHIVILENEFPNDTYAFSRVLEPLNLSMKVIIVLIDMCCTSVVK